MTTPTIVIDSFVGLSLAGNAVAFFSLYFIQRRYSEPSIVHPLRYILTGTFLTTLALITIWILERGIANNHALGWTGTASVGIDLVLISIAWRKFRALHGHKHLSRLTRTLPVVLIFGIIAFALQLATTFQVQNFILDMCRGGAATISIVTLAFSASLVRSRYPGAGIEALIIICSMTAIVIGATFIGQINGRTESLVIENQTKVFQEFIARQSEIHLTAKAFIPRDVEGQKAVASFVEQFITTTTKRVKVILPDGLIIGSDAPERILTRVTVDEDMTKGFKGIGTVRYAPTADSLPETEKNLGSAMIVTMPLRVSSGQGTLGVLRLFLDSSATDIAAAGLQSRAVGFTVLYVVLTQLFLLSFFLIFRKTISHPFAELQDELKDVHEVSLETGENRRLVVKVGGPFQKLADDINRIINEDEQRIRDLKHIMEKKGWQE